jgi:hypothetical protein
LTSPEVNTNTAPFTVRIWCRDCTGQDDMGCFEGGSDLLHEMKHPFTLREFATLEEAKDAGWEETKDCGPWEFDVEQDGEKVFESVEPMTAGDTNTAREREDALFVEFSIVAEHGGGESVAIRELARKCANAEAEREALRERAAKLEEAHAVHVKEDGAVNWGCVVCDGLAGVPVAEEET